MATISIFEGVTLDGVMQGPGRADEDSSGGFVHGGWADGLTDEVAMHAAGEEMAQSVAMLFGHKTYDDLLAHWTTVPEANPFTEALVNGRKYVVSRSAGTTLAYPNSTLLTGEATETVARLRDEVEGVVMILGSGVLVRALHAAGLIDRYFLSIAPIVLGSGTRLFGEGDRADLHLVRSIPTTTGAVLATYDRAR
jgi:dihydrofolate reductase